MIRTIEELEDFCRELTNGDAQGRIDSPKGMSGIHDPDEGYTTLTMKAVADHIRCLTVDPDDIDWNAFVRDMAENCDSDTDTDDPDFLNDLEDTAMDALMNLRNTRRDDYFVKDSFTLPISKRAVGKIISNCLTDSIEGIEGITSDYAYDLVGDIMDAIREKNESRRIRNRRFARRR